MRIGSRSSGYSRSNRTVNSRGVSIIRIIITIISTSRSSSGRISRTFRSRGIVGVLGGFVLAAVLLLLLVLVEVVVVELAVGLGVGV